MQAYITDYSKHHLIPQEHIVTNVVNESNVTLFSFRVLPHFRSLYDPALDPWSVQPTIILRGMFADYRTALFC
jgi:hypothetical protein